MKRSFVVGVVAYAAAFFWCVEQAAEDAFEYDVLGRRLVTFNIPTRDYNSTGGGGTRALTKPLAQTTWDYVEVVFKNDTEYYASAATRGKDLSFTLPVGTYQAVMFAGVGEGTRLLAVGVPTEVDGSDADVDKHGSIEITANIKKITFTLSALTTDIISGASFTVDGESIPGGVYTLDGEDVPYFWVPSDEGEIGGTFKIGGFGVAGGVPDAADLFATPGLFGVVGATSNIIQAVGIAEGNIPPLAVGEEVTGMGIAGGGVSARL
jgi:hypothetical protein